jgi:hypothetical protein
MMPESAVCDVMEEAVGTVRVVLSLDITAYGRIWPLLVWFGFAGPYRFENH